MVVCILELKYGKNTKGRCTIDISVDDKASGLEGLFIIPGLIAPITSIGVQKKHHSYAVQSSGDLFLLDMLEVLRSTNWIMQFSSIDKGVSGDLSESVIETTFIFEKTY